ncbi:hypothetical protein [Photobacterium angustum]|uniref:hypothetical protein n=1 Tax=Photobacterium angustum TaxID=661 RepID=UPI001F5B1AD2|nr:hypothetical protein [Photobacterium angustum]
MSRKRPSVKDLLERLTSYTAHFDEQAVISKKDWLSYLENMDEADSDFLVERVDVFDSSRFEFWEDDKIKN